MLANIILNIVSAITGLLAGYFLYYVQEGPRRNYAAVLEASRTMEVDFTGHLRGEKLISTTERLIMVDGKALHERIDELLTHPVVDRKQCDTKVRQAAWDLHRFAVLKKDVCQDGNGSEAQRICVNKHIVMIANGVPQICALAN